MPPPLYRVRLRLRAPLGTPLTSGTLFGHLCWAVLEREGDARLQRFLEDQNETPWVVSDGFPAGLLPRPLLSPALRTPMPTGASPSAVADAAAARKSQARRPWVKVEDFQAIRNGLNENALVPRLAIEPSSSSLADVRVAHNRIDRRTGTTPKEGGLFFVGEDWRFADEADGGLRDVYVRTPASADAVRNLFQSVGEMGYGRDATWGRGRFDVADVRRDAMLDSPTGNRWLSLSHGVITDGMRSPRYRLVTHFGKIGEGMARRGRRPWKRPILLARPGATFAAEGDEPFGILLRDVHEEDGSIRHDARHVAVRFTEALQ
ncbi:hypothetical protein FHP25_03055 [Vineibacter terrae]|uniref:CRISPR system Cms protein Csm4 n=1 Tax=Vineibacter terrae TaxID=2586908 RepID=A0A5C8PV33_9HYPH|nr:hypothetical protein [Vineibacter terrae]TXL82056.1 hypothetical protein FHP25_03055 [Vineibacter terrae]